MRIWEKRAKTAIPPREIMSTPAQLFSSKQRWWLLNTAFATTLLCALLYGLCAGQYAISPGRVLGILAAYLSDGLTSPMAMDERVVLLSRGPRVLLAAVCGAGLALAGAAMQGIFRNPLAAPEMLGVSSGAAFGGALALLMGLAGLMLIGVAFLCGVLALALVGSIARKNGHSDTTMVILAGVIVGAFFSALVSVTQLFADPHNSLPAIVFWLMGSFAATTWERLVIAAPIIAAGNMLLWRMRFRINILSLGDEEARSLGVSVEKERWLIFLSVALIVGAAVSVAGIIGWVGIVVPHVARMMVGHDHRQLLPASCLLGAAYLCLVDTLARSAMSSEFPLGVLTAVIGAPFIAILLRRLQHAREVI